MKNTAKEYVWQRLENKMQQGTARDIANRFKKGEKEASCAITKVWDPVIIRAR